MTTIITSITAVFTAMASWFVSTLNSVSELFFNSNDGTLTLIGTVTIIGFAIAITTMLLAWIRSLLRGQ